jgi:hypothetical protein
MNTNAYIQEFLAEFVQMIPKAGTNKITTRKLYFLEGKK